MNDAAGGIADDFAVGLCECRGAVDDRGKGKGKGEGFHDEWLTVVAPDVFEENSNGRKRASWHGVFENRFREADVGGYAGDDGLVAGGGSGPCRHVV